jgi:uncharacterized protein (DUF302 family)
MLIMNVLRNRLEPLLCLALIAVMVGCGDTGKGVDALYVLKTEKSADQVLIDLQAAAKRNKFGVLNIHDLKSTLEGKGFPIESAVYVLDVCNPEKAQRVLTEDIGMSVGLPCRIAIYEEDGGTRIAMIRPTQVMVGVSNSEALETTAGEVEDILIKIMDEAR